MEVMQIVIEIAKQLNMLINKQINNLITNLMLLSTSLNRDKIGTGIRTK